MGPSSVPHEKGHNSPHFSAHFYCGQTVAHFSSCSYCHWLIDKENSWWTRLWYYIGNRKVDSVVQIAVINDSQVALLNTKTELESKRNANKAVLHISAQKTKAMLQLETHKLHLWMLSTKKQSSLSHLVHRPHFFVFLSPVTLALDLDIWTRARVLYNAPSHQDSSSYV